MVNERRRKFLKMFQKLAEEMEDAFIFEKKMEKLKF